MSEIANQANMETCPAIGYQAASVCVPVTITPFAKTGTTFTKCCGGPSVRPGRQTCPGVKNGACYFTMAQDICVAIPVAFGAEATVGDTYVNCIDASADDICTDCTTMPVYEPEVAVAVNEKAEPAVPAATVAETATTV